MSIYTEEDLRDFVDYAKKYVLGNFDQDNKPDPKELDKVEELVRIIITMRFNAMVFESFVQGHPVKEYILSKDLKQLPLHLNDEGLLNKIIIKWRLQRNK